MLQLMWLSIVYIMRLSHFTFGRSNGGDGMGLTTRTLAKKRSSIGYGTFWLRVRNE
jgi:hypothetical protein